MNLKNSLLCKYGSEIKASELETLFGVDLLEILKVIAKSKGEKFESDRLVDFSVPTREVAAQIIAQETETSTEINSKDQTPVGA